MTKVVSASEFKARCLRLIDEMQKDGEPVTITRRGKVVAELTPATSAKPVETRKPLFGLMKGSVTAHGDITGPVDPDWERKWLEKWDRRLADDPA